jgi:hypothetical protein
MPQGTGDPLPAAFRDRAATGSAGPSSAVPPSPPAQILPDGIRNVCANSDPISMAGCKPTSMPPEYSQAKPRANLRSILFPRLDRPGFYPSGLPTRTLAAYFACTYSRKRLCECTKLVDAFRQSVRCSSGITRNENKEKKKRRQGGVGNENKRHCNHTKRKCD